MQNTKLKVIDYLIIILCFIGAVFSGRAFWMEYNRTLTKLNEDPAGIIIFKKRTAQRKFIDRSMWDRLKQTSPVYNGDTIRTIEQSEAIIIFQDEVTYLTMDENTMIQVYYNNLNGASIDFSGGNLDVTSENKNVIISSGTSSIVLDGKARLNKYEEEFILSVFNGTASFNGNKIESGGILALDSSGNISTKPVIAMTSFGSPAYVLGSSTESTPVVFSWNDINFNPDTFVIVEVSGNRGFNSILESREVYNASSVSITLENGNYWWRAYPASSSSRVPESRLFPSGRLEVIPSAPIVLLSPSPEEEIIFSGKTLIPLSWTNVDNASAYMLEISAHEDMKDPVISRRVEENSIIQTGLDFGCWYWSVTPIFPFQISGASASSAIGKFSVVKGSSSLAAPELTFPLQNGKTYLDSSGKRLLWAYDSQADSWQVELADNPDMVNPVVKQQVVNNFFPLPPEILNEGKIWYWRVIAQGGESPAVSTISNFEVSSGKAPAVKPVLAELSYLPILPPVFFNSNNAGPNGGITEALSRVVLTLNTYSEYRLRLEGHANPTSHPDDAVGRLHEQIDELQPLSEMRAKAVAEQLFALGIEQNRIELSGCGGESPLAAWEDNDNWWRNRRVEFFLVK